ncbi:2-oxo acid dehydrogenase subunit E2 [Pseudomonas sp. REP124]|uniref:dihydrolipoamide acetyltransferase family protein n=1 Tax=Pseudomonas sp. REP124 TaxID=2875731 RepID=UPI001CCED1CA|nr:2-oxo acid dehydrogenase subunit E2 [Pseudomonas sp. REP124]MBZ9783761.1 2-oxo acid dehydrogenase subunit E2 [Pseudomonas sp. REP124]
MNDLNRTELGATDIIAPLQQEGTKAILRTWLKKDGEQVHKDEPIAELETDKVVVEVCAPCSGLLHVVMSQDSDAPPGALLGRIAQGTPQALLRADQVNPAPREKKEQPDGYARHSPSVRRLIADHNFDPSTIKGSGRGGRLTREDVIGAIGRQSPREVHTQVFTQSASAEAPPPKLARDIPQIPPTDSQVSAYVPHSSMRRRIAEHMQQSVNTAPHVTSVFEADFSAIIKHREKHKADYARQGVKLTFTAYFIAAAAGAMAAAPDVNSRWHPEHMELFRDVNIGVGVSLWDKGLIVPVIHRTQERSLLGIASHLQMLTDAAQRGKLKAEDVQGGTFTISNHGVSGSLFATPIIINQPQSAILGIGALEKRVVVREIDGSDCIQVRPMAYVSLTIDHRVIDGSQTNAWLSRFVELLEDWPVDA